MARYVVDVMPKREILDPQGKAVRGALARLGFAGVADVRQGKRFEVEIEGEAGDGPLAEVRRMAETLLANPVIENFTVTLDGAPTQVTGERHSLPEESPEPEPEPEREPEPKPEVVADPVGTTDESPR